MRSCATLVGLWLLAPTACVVTASVGSDGGTRGEGSGDAGGSAAGSDGGSGTAAVTGDDGSASGGTSGSDGGSSSDGGGTDLLQACMSIGMGGPVDACVPAADDTVCVGCVKLSCCAALTACDSFATCVCLLACAAGGLGPATCADTCGDPGSGCDLGGCGEAECAQACGG